MLMFGVTFITLGFALTAVTMAASMGWAHEKVTFLRLLVLGILLSLMTVFSSVGMAVLYLTSIGR